MKVEEIGIFFDRDGTLNTELDFLSRPEELQLIPHVARAIREANEFGVKVFVMTNQSGIARGLFTEHDLDAIHKRLKTLLAEEHAYLDGIYYCPHHPEYGTTEYKKVCDCRKPKPGMLTRAAHEHHVQLNQSFVIGDRCIDIAAGKTAGCTTALVLTGYGTVDRNECLHADFIAQDAYEAWLHIKKILVKHHHKHTIKR